MNEFFNLKSKLHQWRPFIKPGNVEKWHDQFLSQVYILVIAGVEEGLSVVALLGQVQVAVFAYVAEKGIHEYTAGQVRDQGDAVKAQLPALSLLVLEDVEVVYVTL